MRDLLRGRDSAICGSSSWRTATIIVQYRIQATDCSSLTYAFCGRFSLDSARYVEALASPDWPVCLHNRYDLYSRPACVTVHENPFNGRDTCIFLPHLFPGLPIVRRRGRGVIFNKRRFRIE